MGWELRLLWITALGIRGNGFSSSRSMAKGLNYGFVAKVLGEFLLNKDLLFSQTGKRISTPRMSQGCCSSYAFIFEAHMWDYLLQLGPIAQPYSSSIRVKLCPSCDLLLQPLSIHLFPSEIRNLPSAPDANHFLSSVPWFQPSSALSS